MTTTCNRKRVNLQSTGDSEATSISGDALTVVIECYGGAGE